MSASAETSAGSSAAAGQTAPAAGPAAALAGLPCRLLIDPDIDPGLLPCPPAGFFERPAEESVAADEWLAAHRPEKAAPALFVTRKPLRTAHCSSVFGYADRHARAAIVSLARLESDEPETTRRRLAAVAAHELGHLAGYGHCRTPGCLMRPAESADDLDTRQPGLCSGCRARRRWPLAAGLLAVCLLLSLSLDAVIEKIRNRTQVFSWRLSGQNAALVLEQEELLRLRNPAEAQAAADALNALYASMTPPPLHVEAGGGRIEIAAGGRQVIRMDWVETGGVPPEEFARRWIARIDPVIQGKGTVQQGCPSCHIERRGEVLDAMARRSRWWR